MLCKRWFGSFSVRYMRKNVTAVLDQSAPPVFCIIVLIRRWDGMNLEAQVLIKEVAASDG